MKQRPFKQIDVFTAEAYRGNPLAVVLDAANLSDQEMQRFARWTNLSETTFLLPPQTPPADYRVRIFTPGGELPFAGHPTIGSCHAWLQAGGRPRDPNCIIQECGVGLVRLRRNGEQLAFAAPPMRRSEVDSEVLTQLLAALGLERREVLAAQTLDNGPVWLSLLIDRPQTVLRLRPDHARLAQLAHKVGVAARYADATRGGPHLEVRAFAAPIGITEDPVTGSLNASLAQWLIADGRLPPQYVAAQGECVGRGGRVFVDCDAQSQVWIGGDAVTCIQGNVLL